MKRVFLVALLVLLFVFPSHAATIWWDANTEPDLAGYRLYYGPTQGQWDTLIVTVLAPQTSVILSELPEGYYVLKAYDTEGLESGPSNEVLLAAYYYNSIRYDYDKSGRIMYKGEHTEQDASVSDTNWIISRYYYTGGMVMQVRRRTTSWTNRTQGW